MERLKKLRLDKKLLQKDVADIIGVDRTTYVKYENGQSEPNFDIISRLADYFNVSTDYLLGRQDNQNKEPATDDGDGLEEWAKIYRLIPMERRAEYRAMLEAALRSQGLI